MSTPKIFYNNSTKKWNLILKSGLSGEICFGDCSGSNNNSNDNSNDNPNDGGNNLNGDIGVITAPKGGRPKDIYYFNFSVPNSIHEFGNLTTYSKSSRDGAVGLSNGINDRGIFAGGMYVYDKTSVNIIDYITISTPGNSQDFGDLIFKVYSCGGVSNSINNRGVIAGGSKDNSASMNDPIDIIQYITISTPGNAQQFGKIKREGYHSSDGKLRFAGTSNGINDRGIFGGGKEWVSSYESEPIGTLNIIDYITISTPGNSQDFGDLTHKREFLGATSNGVNDRAVFGGGGERYIYDDVNDDYPAEIRIRVEKNIDYVTISTPSNATNFGNLTVAMEGVSGSSNGTDDRGVFFGNAEKINIMLPKINYITISTPGNAQDFSDYFDNGCGYYCGTASTSNA